MEEDLKSVVAGCEKVCDLYPEIQEMAFAVHTILASDSIANSLKSGMQSADSVTASTFKMMSLVEMMVKSFFLSVL